MTTTKKLIVLLAAALGACGADTSGIVIRGRAAPSDETECRFASTGDFRLGTGVFDVGASYGQALVYDLPLYLTNSLTVPPGQRGEATSQQKTWFAKSARVRVRPSGLSATITSAPIAVEAGNGTSAQAFEVINRELALQLQGQAVPGELRRVVLDITLQGETQDGEDLDTNEFSYPIDLCVDCLALAAPCAAGQVATYPGCGNVGQDVALACAAAPAP